MKQEIPEQNVNIQEEDNKAAQDLEVGDAYEIPKSGEFVVTQMVEKDTQTGKIIELHGDVNEKPMAISKAKLKNPVSGSIVEQGLWVSIKEGKLDYNSSLAIVLRKFAVKKAKDLIGKKIPVTRDTNGFWIINAQ